MLYPASTNSYYCLHECVNLQYNFHRFLYGVLADDKVTVLESEKKAWESSPEAQAIREALNPWRKHKAEERKDM